MRKVNHWVSYNCDGIILDIGTGHGDWAYEVASTYPKSKIIGLDLNPPTVPVTIQNNLEFKIQDITQRWDIPDNSVDFLFQRDMNRVLLKSDWKHVLREMYRVAQPGGVLEIVEPDLFHHNAGPVQTAADEYFKDQCEKIGRDWSLADHLSEDLTNIGFINVEKKSLDIPVGEWPSDPNLKQIGFNNFELQRSKLRAMRANYVNVVGLSAEEYDAASKQILSEYEDYQGYTIWVCWTAQKPA
ncbi:S-adenosyl-L-methionine-dependent methyltransferase [Umbelopsis sp. PMI_123]|nr:S-adenosyl-L-methionine-dependent methyltransferase [Umbelopsis sp. PMI_123]